jgi:hypothetical protein
MARARAARSLLIIRLIAGICLIQAVFAAIIIMLAPSLEEPAWKRTLLRFVMLALATTSIGTSAALARRSPNMLRWFSAWSVQLVIASGLLPYLFMRWTPELWLTAFSGVVAMSLALFFIGRYLRRRLTELSGE